MQITQYETLIIKCDHAIYVCDSLMSGLSKQAVKIGFKQQPNAKASHSSSLTSQNKYFDKQGNKQHIMQSSQYSLSKLNTQQQQVDKNIDKFKKILKQLKTQKYQMNNSQQYQNQKGQNSSSSTFQSQKSSFKKSKQIQQLQKEVNHQKRLYNAKMQNLNSINQNKLEMDYLQEMYSTKQTQLIKAIQQLSGRDRQFFRFKSLEESYELLLKKKRESMEFIEKDQASFEKILEKKIHAVSQSIKNINQMQEYLNKLQEENTQMAIVIEQIIARQKQEQNQQNKDNFFEQTDQFDEQIKNLRRTIERFKNKKKKSKNKNNNKSNSLNNDDSDSAPKNNQIKKKKENNSSVFKIQIEPSAVSHHKSEKKNQAFDKQNNVNNTESNLTHSKINEKKKKNTNLPIVPPKNLSTLEVQMIQKILAKKQNQYKQIMVNMDKHTSGQRDSQNSKKNTSISIKNNKKLAGFNNSSSQKQISSKHISQILGSPQSGIMNRLQNNIRFRTKKTEQIKANESLRIIKSRHRKHFVPLFESPNLKKDSISLSNVPISHNDANLNIRSQSHSLAKSNESSVQLPSPPVYLAQNQEKFPSPNPSLKNISKSKQFFSPNYPQSQQQCQNSNSSAEDAQSQQINFRKVSMNLKRNKNLKYRGRIQSSSLSGGDTASSIETLNRRLGELRGRSSKIRGTIAYFSDKNTIAVKDQSKNSQLKKQQQVEIIKLSNSRKYKGSMDPKGRKGTDMNVQESNDQSSNGNFRQVQLSQIDEQDQIAKATTISHR